jgi:hypothetical protein
VFNYTDAASFYILLVQTPLHEPLNHIRGDAVNKTVNRIRHLIQLTKQSLIKTVNRISIVLQSRSTEFMGCLVSCKFGIIINFILRIEIM